MRVQRGQRCKAGLAGARGSEHIWHTVARLMLIGAIAAPITASLHNISTTPSRTRFTPPVYSGC
jgi:hypothetical protein